MTATAAFYDIGDVGQRVGGAGIFSKGVISQVNPAGMGINCHIFQNGTEAAGRLVDLRFGFFGEIDDLGIATAFEVEDPFVIPTMLVIADQKAIRISGEGRFPGSGQAEEDGGITLWPSIGGAVHGQDLLFYRQEIVENGKDRFLDFSGIAGAANDNHFAGKMDDDEGFGVGAVHGGDGVEVRHSAGGDPCRRRQSIPARTGHGPAYRRTSACRAHQTLPDRRDD